MKDIDFDELDKAVNSVLSQDQQTPVAEPASGNVAVVDRSTVAVSGDAPVSVAPDPTPLDAPTLEAPSLNEVAAPELVEVSQSETTPVLATKRRGKFMDVVHPSSDMNPSASSISTPDPAPKKQELAPISPDMVEVNSPIEAQPPADLSPSDEISADTPEVEAPQELETPFSPEIHLEEAQPADPVSSSVEPVTPDVASVSEESTDNPVVETTEATTETPFLTDAKVDKRPLGAFGEQGSEDAGSETPTQTSDIALAASPLTLQTPRELQPDIVEVEKVSDETVEVDTASQLTTVSSDTAVPPPDGEPDHDESAHPVFDASTYQQPLVAAKSSGKNKPAWLWWLMGILVCLVIGAGVGYMLFIVGF